VRYLVIGGLAVVVVGEPRITADADAVVFMSPVEAEALICEAAEDASLWGRLQGVLVKARVPEAE